MVGEQRLGGIRGEERERERGGERGGKKMGRMRSGRGDEGKRLTDGKCNHFPTYSFPSDKQPIIACNSAMYVQ